MSSGKSELERFSRDIRALNVMPLWERIESAMRPGTDCVPCIWRYSELRPRLLEIRAH